MWGILRVLAVLVSIYIYIYIYRPPCAGIFDPASIQRPFDQYLQDTQAYVIYVYIYTYQDSDHPKSVLAGPKLLVDLQPAHPFWVFRILLCAGDPKKLYYLRMTWDLENIHGNDSHIPKSFALSPLRLIPSHLTP